MSNKIRFYREVNGQPVGDLVELLHGQVLRVSEETGQMEAIPGCFSVVGTPVNAVAASGTLTIATQPSLTDTITIGEKTYTFVAEVQADADGEIGIGADLAAAKVNIVAAINGTDGFNTAHPVVTAAAFSGDDCVITAATKGALANATATTTALDDATDDFAAATLEGGIDGTLGINKMFMADATNLYVATGEQTVSDATWKKIALDAL